MSAPRGGESVDRQQFIATQPETRTLRNGSPNMALAFRQKGQLRCTWPPALRPWQESEEPRGNPRSRRPFTSEILQATQSAWDSESRPIGSNSHFPLEPALSFTWCRVPGVPATGPNQPRSRLGSGLSFEPSFRTTLTATFTQLAEHCSPPASIGVPPSGRLVFVSRSGRNRIGRLLAWLTLRM